jgi:hypothetical protein
MQSDEIIRDLQSAQTPAILRAVDSCSKDCGNDGFYFVISYLGLSSWKFRRGEIPTFDIVSRNYPGSTARTNVGNFTRYRFLLKRLRE